jgi:predicted O-methyltransferase YrrM
MVGDAVEMIATLEVGVDFVLVDLWKDLYLPCLTALRPKLNSGAILVADNISPGREDVREYVTAIRTMPDMASVPVPVGQGLEISRYMAA